MMDLLVLCLQAATPIWLAALGGLIAQRSGVLHLGLEGLMLCGAFTVVAVTVRTGSLALALLIAIGVNLVISVVFWLLISKLKANAIIVGLAISMTAAAGTTFALVTIFGSQAAIHTDAALPRPLDLTNGPLAPLGKVTVLTYVAVALTVAAVLILTRTRWGLRLSVCGVDEFAARSAGVNVVLTRLVALCVAGVCCALAGTELALANVQSFSENMTQGRGYLAFIAVLLGGVSPAGVAAASVFFGLADGLGVRSQLGLHGVVPVQFIQMLPYLCTIGAMAAAAVINRRRGVGPPTNADDLT
ncbi:ABC transporter permease [Kribbella sp. NPDC050241]|jgi:general nucleoside transport system permease protein|uniref:ABC transporter permease n=1 Tax=Kribbella sp. NPDC050241 TaxID=3364115 RepID=UPI0037B17A29